MNQKEKDQFQVFLQHTQYGKGDNEGRDKIVNYVTFFKNKL